MTPSRAVYAKAAKAAKAAEKLQSQKELDPQLSLELHDQRANKSTRWAQLRWCALTRAAIG